MRPIAERHGLTPLQLACQWNLAHGPVKSVVPTLIQEPGPDARTIEVVQRKEAVGEEGVGEPVTLISRATRRDLDDTR